MSELSASRDSCLHGSESEYRWQSRRALGAAWSRQPAHMHGRCVQALWAAQVKAMEWRVRYLAETRPGAETHSVLVQNIPGIAFGTLPSRSKVRTTLTVDLHTYSRWQSCRTGRTCEAQHWLPLPIPDALRPPFSGACSGRLIRRLDSAELPVTCLAACMPGRKFHTTHFHAMLL